MRASRITIPLLLLAASACGGEAARPAIEARRDVPAPLLPARLPAEGVDYCRDAPPLLLATHPEPGDRLLLTVNADTTGVHGVLYGAFVIRADGTPTYVERIAGIHPWTDAAVPWGVWPGARFTLLEWGRPAGIAQVDSIRDNDGAVSTFHFSGEAREPSLAAGFPVPDGAPLLYRPTSGERHEMLALLRDTVAARQWFWDDVRDRNLQVNTVVFPGGEAVVGSALVRNERDVIGRPLWSLFMVAEPDSSGHLRARYARFEAEDDPYSPSLLDVADLDGDGVPELLAVDDITHGGGEMSIFRRGWDGWREVLRTGC
jgi:hypothetical protein